MCSHRCEMAIAWSPCRSEDPRWMNPAGWPLFPPSCQSYVRTIASKMLRMTSVGSSPEEKTPVWVCRLGMCVPLLTNRAHPRRTEIAQSRLREHLRLTSKMGRGSKGPIFTSSCQASSITSVSSRMIRPASFARLGIGRGIFKFRLQASVRKVSERDLVSMGGSRPARANTSAITSA
jgi:hypothetical protein